LSRIPRHLIDQVRERTDIVEIVARHVRLSRKGSSQVGLCPFHQEKTPSFNVVASKGIYHCFGCNAHGDVFRFLMELEGLSFVEAVKELASAAGVVIEERELSPDEARQIRKRASLFDVLEAAAAFFENTLWTKPEGRIGRSYLKQRKITTDTARNARIGFAPGGWTALIDHLHHDGYPPELIFEAGLARKRAQSSGHYDTFRDRLIIPICDDRGRVVAFGGRILEGDGPKYINSPETSFYRKSSTLYALDVARTAIQRENTVILVEGYFDVLSMHQAGFKHTVATCGTALTPDHLIRIKRLTRNAILLLDADEAGQRAAERSMLGFLEAGIQPWRLEIIGAKDPDELIRDGGAEAMTRALDCKQPLVEWVVQKKIEALGGSIAGRDTLIEELMPVLVRLPGDLLSRVAARTAIPEAVLIKRVGGAYRPSHPQPPPSAPSPSNWKPTRDVVHLLWLLVHRYDQIVDLMGDIHPSILQDHVPIQAVIARLVTGEGIAAIIQDNEDPAISRTLAAVVAKAALYAPNEAATGLCQVLERLRRPVRQARLNQLQGLLDRSIRTKDYELQRLVLTERKELTSIKKQIERCLLRGDIQEFRRLVQAEADLEERNRSI